MTTDLIPSRAAKAAAMAVIAGLAAMFVWSLAYRTANPSLTVTPQSHGMPPAGGKTGGAMDAMGGPVMKAVIEAMAKLKQNPEDVEALHDAAIAFASAEMWEKAGQLTDKALTKSPDDHELLNLKGVVEFRLEKTSEAAKTFERLLSLDPKNFQVQFNLGAVYKHGLQDPARAKPYFEAVLANPAADEETRQQAREELKTGQ